MATFGVDSALVGGQLVLKLPTKCLWWFIQNQSQSPLKVSFLSNSWGNMTSIVLDGAPVAGGAGGYLSSIAWPYFSPDGVLLSSTDLVAPFGSGASPMAPVNTILAPGQGPGAFS